MHWLNICHTKPELTHAMQHDTRPPASGSRTARRPIAILSYHQTARPPRRGTPVRSLVLPPSRFARQLRALRLLGWRGMSMRDLGPYLQGEKTGKVFGITLDDGYLNNYEEALPVLRALGFTATAFIVSGQVGGSNVWDHPKGAPAVPLMGLLHLREWLAAGMEIGGHTRNHVNLCECDDDTAREEIAGCKRDLEQSLGVEVRSFSYPYGAHRGEHAQMVREAGYATATTIVSSRVRPEDDALRLPRISVHLQDKLPRLLAQVTTDYEDWRMRRPKNRLQPTSRWYQAAAAAVQQMGSSGTANP
ncbi:polysaccharide deacetylase family protein [Ramlibacter tataouinensis]|uniref:polysaccharide deacetylase family protein n=1 Tax=Ramlibacter tataouinensis TaxID=94132 RepID=UPI0022F3CEA3|nr:polysaccharide deacetylase family protein [Ramlibacter tataouinensis]WBY03350.1 polysaccharide deacetylase family protein [Ramlibacter tataouinensis]